MVTSDEIYCDLFSCQSDVLRSATYQEALSTVAAHQSRVKPFHHLPILYEGGVQVPGKRQVGQARLVTAIISALHITSTTVVSLLMATLTKGHPL